MIDFFEDFFVDDPVEISGGVQGVGRKDELSTVWTPSEPATAPSPPSSSP
jgi:hypothetical protein